MLMKSLLFYLLKLVNRLIPKNSNNIVFCSYPDYSDNPKYLYDYLITLHKYNLFWLVNDKANITELNKLGIKNIYYKKSIKGILCFMKSKYFFSSHMNCFDFKVNSQKYFELWHGIPLKRLMFRQNELPDKHKRSLSKRIQNIDYFCSTSNLVSLIFAANFNLDVTKLIEVGYPRNDVLNKKNKNLNILFPDIKASTKVILYCPTYRVWSEYKTNEGTPRESIFGYGDLDNIKLEEMLEKYNAKILLKLHPFEEEYYIKQNIKLPNNVCILTQKQLSKNGLTLYDVLNKMDGLITDYSSIYFDYLILDRPIIFNLYDKEQYDNSRGFNLTPLPHWLPGEIIDNSADLLSAIEDVLLEDDSTKEKRAELNKIFNENYNFDASIHIEEIISKLNQ